MTGGSQRRVRCVSSRNDTAPAQVQVMDSPNQPSLADDAVLLSLREIEAAILVFDLLACAIDTADYAIRVSDSFNCKLVQTALIGKHWLWLVLLRFGGILKGRSRAKDMDKTSRKRAQTYCGGLIQVRDAAALTWGGILPRWWLLRPCCDDLLRKT